MHWLGFYVNMCKSAWGRELHCCLQLYCMRYLLSPPPRLPCRESMSEEADLSRPWSELPMPALIIAFEKLDLRDRSGAIDCVARVCSTWAEAAAAATRSIKLKRCSNTDSLQQWLRSRGAHVGVICLEGTCSGGVITTLPCARLEELILFWCSVDLSRGSQLLQDLSAATALNTLDFWGVTFHGDPDLAAVLSALPGLTFLRLMSSQVLKTTQQPTSSTASALTSGVQDSHARPQCLWSAQHTTDEGYQCLTDIGMQFICKLTKLQDLGLHSLQGVTAAGLAGLVSLRGLKGLDLRDLSCDISLSAVPAFSQLTYLTGLRLVWKCSLQLPTFDPAVLGCMRQLRCLDLWSVNPARGTAGAAELLSSLAQLHKLETLSLMYIPSLDKCPPAAFSSLTSSSVLRCLVLVSVAACQ